MKKIFISTLAALGLVACVQEQVLDITTSRAIAFDNAFIENATRAAADPSTTNATIDGFNVWAFVDVPTGTVFNGDQVKKTGDTWSYTNPQYWTPGHAYYFAALSPMDSDNWDLAEATANTYGAGVVSFTNVDGSEDLLYASTMVETPAMEELLNGMAPVQFQFNHLLSKVKFTFVNGFATDNVYVAVSNVTMTSPKSGTLALNTQDWWIGDKWETEGTETYMFGNVDMLGMGAAKEAHDERLLIPVSKEYTYDIQFDVTVYMGELVALEHTKKATVTGVALEMGKAYNFAAEINPENLYLPSIEFDVTEVKEWNYAGEHALPGYQPDMKITTAFDFEAALAAKWPKITLGANIELTSGETNVIGDLVLDLNGYSIICNRNYPSETGETTTPRISTLYVDGVQLTIIGEGTIANDASTSAYAVAVANGGRAIIRGNVHTRSYHDPLYVRRGELYVENGFHVSESDTDPLPDANGCHASTVVNCYDNDWTDVFITGGTFVNMDPSNVHEWKKHNMSFVVDGYTVVSEAQDNGDIWYTVVLN